MKKRIYLAGPMGGLTLEEATTWRNYVSSQLYLKSDGRIECYSPLRGGCIAFDDDAKLASADINPTPFTTNRAIMTRDYIDCVKADLVFAYFLDAPKISIGTVMEMGFAYAHRIPVVAVINNDCVHSGHPMMEETFTYRVSSLDDGIDAAFHFLIP
jgi:nucleoside 2-deoxyribosyltransferase